MRTWHRLRELLKTLFRGTRVDRDLEDEVDDWVATLAERHRAEGCSPEEARRRALIAIGGAQQIKEEARAMRNGSQLESTATDVRYAWRALRRSPGFAAAAVFTFALGIGATTAIVSVVKAVLVEPLPYRDPSRLVFVWADMTDLGYPHAPLAGPELAEFEERTTSIERIGGIWATNATLGGVGDPEQLRMALVTADFFTVLGVDARLGRVLGPDDIGQPLTPIVLSDALWQTSFGADPDVVGRRITLNDRPATVVGVMPKHFELLFPPDASVPPDLQAWMPGASRPMSQPRGQQYLRVVARLRPEADVRDAVDEVAAVGRAIIAANPGNYSPGSRFYAVPMQEDNVRPVRASLLAVFAGGALLLVIACVNIAGLLVVRAAGRARETAVRVALGAGQARLVRQFLVEGLLLSTIGGAVGVLAGSLALRVLVSLAPASLGRAQAADLDWGVLAFAGTASLLWGVVFSLTPWIEARREQPDAALRQGARAGSPRAARVRGALVVAQVALSFVLLVGAALLGRTFGQLMSLDPGFRSEGILTFRVAPPPSRYAPGDANNAFHRELMTRLRALPGVTGVGAVSHLPWDNLPNWGTPYLPMGELDGSKAGLTDTRAVAPSFFETIGARLLAGRFFDERDSDDRAMPVVIDEVMAQRLFGDADPLRRQVQVDLGGTGGMAVMEVIGVVEHLRHRSLVDRGREQLFVSSRLWFRNPASYVVRTDDEPTTLAAPIRRVVQQLDPLLPVYDVRPMTDYLTGARAPNRFTMLLSTAFAGIALVLACVGVYGVVAQSAGRRAREFGIRVALGADSAQVSRLVLGEGLRLTAAGLLFGALGAFATAGWLGSQLFGVSPYDPVTYASAIGVLGCASLFAGWLPARRTAALPPMDALRRDA